MALKEAWVRFKHWASANQVPHSQGPLTGGLLQEDPYPSLNLKAWNGRVFLIFLDLCIALLAKSVALDDSEPHLASLACSSLCTWFDRTERVGRYLTSAQAGEIAGAGRATLEAYETLAHHAQSMNVVRWKTVPKMHVIRLEFSKLLYIVQGLRFRPSAIYN